MVFIKLCIVYWVSVFLCLCIFHVGGNVLINFTFFNSKLNFSLKITFSKCKQLAKSVCCAELEVSEQNSPKFALRFYPSEVESNLSRIVSVVLHVSFNDAVCC